MKKYAVTTALFVFAGSANPAWSLSLQEAAQIALSTNPEVKAARLEQEARVHEVHMAESGYYPDVTAIVGIGRETTNNVNNQSASLNRKEAGLIAEQMLFDGSATHSEVNRQKARYSAASHSADNTSEALVMEAAKAYLTVLREKDLHDLAQETKESHKTFYDQMELRQTSGVGSQADLDQIKGRLALANTNVLTTEANLFDASTKFQSVVGVYPDVGTMAYPDLTVNLPATLDEAVKKATEKNNLLQAATSDIEAGKAQYEAAKSTFWPRVTLEAQHTANDNVNGISGAEDSTQVAVRMRYKLYAGGEDLARKKETAILMNEAMEIRNDKQRKIIEGLGYSWNSIDAIQRQLPYLQQHVSSAVSTRDAYDQQFSIGRRTLLDLLNTENEVVDAKRSLIRARYDRVISQLQLLGSIGVLRESLGIKDVAHDKSAGEVDWNPEEDPDLKLP
ncbi:MAG TPA: TolC family outer membrane protein [Pseudomonadales bacterium]|nr:TolC family outer membrane protein [Pseudomonadales bacterium]